MLPEQGHSAVMLLVRAPASQGTYPGVAVSGLLVRRLCPHTCSIDLRQNSAAKHEMIIQKQYSNYVVKPYV